jgi:UTP-glucose-1-phosphate uridylyltransferase/galactokinase
MEVKFQVERNTFISEEIDLAVPGRLCLFGEHSDWAGAYTKINADIVQGNAIIVGIEQCIKAKAKKSKDISIQSILPDGTRTDVFEGPMDLKILKDIASKGEFFSYTAGVAAFIVEHYNVGGITLDCYEMTLPLKKGLSSSAAICVLVARAFNKLYDLRLSIRGEMEIAYRGELLTKSRCGRLDQGCSYGKNPICMTIDGDSINVERLKVGKELYWVFADLKACKDTKKILSDLNKCYPFPQNGMERKVHEALGIDNTRIVTDVKKAIESGDSERIGQLMQESQRIFDEKVAPASPEELKAVKLHTILNDQRIRKFVWGGKGIGSQGDGSVQFIARTKEDQLNLVQYFSHQYGLEAYTLDIKQCKSVRKAIVPIAGFGTRMYPATRTFKKELFPVIDKDGLVKPALLILLEELDNSGIEEICLIIAEKDRRFIEAIVSSELSIEHMNKVSPEMREYDLRIRRIGEKITFAYQNERLGLGHAVYQSRSFTNGEPVLLVLGDHLFSSNSDKPCSAQTIEAYDLIGEQLTLAISEVPLSHVSNHGIVCGCWENEEETLLSTTKIFEKPTSTYSRDNLAVNMKNGDKKYFSVFGQYILTPDVFEILARNIREERMVNGEFELTTVLDEIRRTKGMFAFIPQGKCFDIGNPAAYQETIRYFSRKVKDLKVTC